MNLLECVKKLRPGVAWKDDIVRGTSLILIAETYQHEDPLPTYQECEAIWPSIEVGYAQAHAAQEIKNNLELLDKKSIRDIREWIAAQPSAPATLKNYETQAISERAKLK